MKEGEVYFVVQVGKLKIPFFPSKTKEGKKCYRSTLTLWRNEKKADGSSESSESSEEKKEDW